MASLSELTEAAGTAQGIDPASAALVGRYLREAGLIVQRGRGRSASPMNYGAGAALLIGLNSTVVLKEVNRTTQHFMNLTFTIGETRLISPVMADALHKAANFHELLSNLIEIVGNGKYDDLAIVPRQCRSNDELSVGILIVRFYIRDGLAEVALHNADGLSEYRPVWRLSFGPGYPDAPTYPLTGLVSAIGEPSLFAVADAINR